MSKSKSEVFWTEALHELSSHSIVLLEDGRLLAWGDNSRGQLGNGNAVLESLVPIEVADGALSGKLIVAISAGAFHNVALSGAGEIISWGDNANLQVTGSNASATIGALKNEFGTTVSLSKPRIIPSVSKIETKAGDLYRINIHLSSAPTDALVVTASINNQSDLFSYSAFLIKI